MSDRPVVGIVGHGYVVPRRFVDLRVTGTPRAYVDRVAAAGGRPLLLPAGRATELLDLVDAIVLTGGGDVDPTLHGGEPELAVDVERERDDHELAVVRAAAAAHLPVLGVCRGLQVLVIAFGGTLISHLDTDHRLPAEGHPLRTTPGSLVDGLVGRGEAVTSLHHQAVSDPGPCWRVTAWAEDGTAEAAEWAAGDWAALGVQWHPELPDDPTGERVFRWLIDAVHQPAGTTMEFASGKHG